MTVRDRVLSCIEESGIIVLKNGDFENLESINFISSIINIEAEFDLEFPDEYLLMDTFCDFENVVLIVETLLGDRSNNK